MKIAALVALGAAVGGVLRYLIATFFATHSTAQFPYATLLINVTGSFLLGALIQVALGGSMRPEMRALLATGFCGGYTTFSTFSVETVAMFEAGLAGRAITYVLASVLLSTFAALGGMTAVRLGR